MFDHETEHALNKLTDALNNLPANPTQLKLIAGLLNRSQIDLLVDLLSGVGILSPVVDDSNELIRVTPGSFVGKGAL